MRRNFSGLLPLAVIALVVGIALGRHAFSPAPKTVLHLACADLAAGCGARLGGEAVTVGIEGELKVLKPFTVWLKRADTDKVQASFAMEGMDMGFNLYNLRRGADGVFRAQVTLPVCVSGRRDWVMTLDVDGAQLEVPFVTQL